jgi:hypothetical protein
MAVLRKKTLACKNNRVLYHKKIPVLIIYLAHFHFYTGDRIKGHIQLLHVQIYFPILLMSGCPGIFRRCPA